MYKRKTVTKEEAASLFKPGGTKIGLTAEHKLENLIMLQEKKLSAIADSLHTRIRDLEKDVAKLTQLHGIRLAYEVQCALATCPDKH